MVMGGPDIILVLVLALVLFGPKRLPELGRGLGQGIREFKRGTSGIADELKNALNPDELKSALNLEPVTAATIIAPAVVVGAVHAPAGEASAVYTPASVIAESLNTAPHSETKA